MGEYRRNVTTAYRNHDFFRPDNESAMMIRTNCAKVALEDVMLWLENGGGEVAVSVTFNLFVCYTHTTTSGFQKMYLYQIYMYVFYIKLSVGI